MSNPVTLKASTGSRPKNAFASNSRIPLDYCDGPTQRMYAASSFVLLQACKIYYYFQMTQSDYAAGFFGFILWLLLDVLFISTIHYLRIPWLELPALRLIIAFLTLTIFNFVLFTVREVRWNIATVHGNFEHADQKYKSAISTLGLTSECNMFFLWILDPIWHPSSVLDINSVEIYSVFLATRSKLSRRYIDLSILRAFHPLHAMVSWLTSRSSLLTFEIKIDQDAHLLGRHTVLITPYRYSHHGH